MEGAVHIHLITRGLIESINQIIRWDAKLLAGFQSPPEVFNLFLVEGSPIHLYFPTVYGRC